MSKKLEEAMAILSELNLDERGQLAAKILLSLEEPSEEEVEKLWITEAERRLQEYREGKVRGISAEEVFQKAIKRHFMNIEFLPEADKEFREAARYYEEEAPGGRDGLYCRGSPSYGLDCPESQCCREDQQRHQEESLKIFPLQFAIFY